MFAYSIVHHTFKALFYRNKPAKISIAFTQLLFRPVPHIPIPNAPQRIYAHYQDHDTAAHVRNKWKSTAALIPYYTSRVCKTEAPQRMSKTNGRVPQH